MSKEFTQVLNFNTNCNEAPWELQEAHKNVLMSETIYKTVLLYTNM